MRRLLIAGLLLAPVLPADAAEVVYAYDDAFAGPPHAADARCVAVGTAPGTVTLTVVGTSANTWTIVQCSLYERGVYRGAVARKLQAPVSAAGPGTFTVTSPDIRVSASVS